RHHAALQRHLTNQAFAQFKRPRTVCAALAPGKFSDSLQPAILGYIECANGNAQVAGEEIENVLAQHRQRLFANNGFAQLRLPGAVPGLLFQRSRMGLLLFQGTGVTGGKTEQIASAGIHQQPAEDQTEDQETADQQGTDGFRTLGALISVVAVGGNKLIEQAALLLLELQPALAADVFGYVLAQGTLVDN